MYGNARIECVVLTLTKDAYYEVWKLSEFIPYSPERPLLVFVEGLCKGAVSDCEYPGGGSHSAGFLRTVSPVLPEPSKDFAISLSLTWVRLCHSHD